MCQAHLLIAVENRDCHKLSQPSTIPVLAVIVNEFVKTESFGTKFVSPANDVFTVPKNASRAVSNISFAVGFACVISAFHRFFLVTDLLCFTPPLGTCSRSTDILEDVMAGQLSHLEQF